MKIVKGRPMILSLTDKGVMGFNYRVYLRGCRQ